MTARLLSILAVAPAMLEAQIALYSLNGITPSPVGSVYGYGQVAAGDQKDVRFRALNTGTASVTITLLNVVNIAPGAGFSIVNSSSTPFVVAPGNGMDFFVRFSSSDVASYSATLQVNTVSATLFATVVPAPTLSVAAPCTGPDTNLNISFGRISQGGQVSCVFSILNPFPQPLTVSPVTVSGGAFATAAGNAITIAAGQSASFSIQFTPVTPTSFSGTLALGTRAYTLSGTGYTSGLPSLKWSIDSANIASGEQHTLSAQLSAPAPVSAAGSVVLAFTPSNAAIANDSAVQFVATSKRVASFTVNAGETAIKINAQPSIVFSTGTTAGKLTFTADAGVFGIAGDPSISFTTLPAPVSIISSSGTSRANDLDVVVSGFDNTYSMGSMTFTFFDRSGGLIAAIPADFTANFRVFFQSQAAGSSFLMRVSFPVTGNASMVGGVEVQLTNSAGLARTPRINFP